MGRWDYYRCGASTRRRCVDECAWWLSVADFRRDFIADGITGPVVYRVEWRRERPRLVPVDAPPSWTAKRLRSDFAERVEVEPVPWPIYGVRWFFRCCRCVRRCSYLYAPEPGSPFECRECLDLSYQSAQVWNHWQRTGRHPGLLGRIMADLEAGGDGKRVLMGSRWRRRNRAFTKR